MNVQTLVLEARGRQRMPEMNALVGFGAWGHRPIKFRFLQVAYDIPFPRSMQAIGFAHTVRLASDKTTMTKMRICNHAHMLLR